MCNIHIRVAVLFYYQKTVSTFVFTHLYILLLQKKNLYILSLVLQHNLTLSDCSTGLKLLGLRKTSGLLSLIWVVYQHYQTHCVSTNYLVCLISKLWQTPHTYDILIKYVFQNWVLLFYLFYFSFHYYVLYNIHIFIVYC